MSQAAAKPAEQASDQNIVTLNTQSGTQVRLESPHLAMLSDPMRTHVGRNVAAVSEYTNSLLRNQPDLQTAGVNSDQLLDVLDHEITLAINTLRTLTLPITEENDITQRDALRDWVVSLSHTQNPGLPPIPRRIGLPQVGRRDDSGSTEISIREVTGRGSVVVLENKNFTQLSQPQRQRVGIQAGGVMEFADLMVTSRPKFSELQLRDEQLMDVMDHSLTNAMNVVRGLTVPINDAAGIQTRNSLRDWVAGLAHTAEPGLAPIPTSLGQPPLRL